MCSRKNHTQPETEECDTAGVVKPQNKSNKKTQNYASSRD